MISSMPRYRQVQMLLWTYFWLLIFEGALRKWVFPGLSNPLLVVRDPVCILAIALGWGVLRRSVWWKWVVGIWAIGIVAVVLAVFAGHGDVFTAVYGARILFLHFPLVFLYALFFDRDDIWSFAKAILIVAIPMTFLIALQYSLPQSHFLNLAPGGEEGVGFAGALGKLRPPGTFSFTNGLSNFYPLAAGAFAAWITAIPARRGNRWIWASASALIIALPVSISRTILFGYALVAAFTLLAAVLSGRAIRNFLIGSVVVAGLFLGVSQLAIFQDAREAFNARWQMATEAEGGREGGVAGVLANRVGGTFLNALQMIPEVPLAGAGIGLGTNVGAKLSTGERAFLIAEGAWGSMIGELGSLLGVLLLLWRTSLAMLMVAAAVVEAMRKNTLPLILGSSALPAMVLGGTAQPTALGFLVVGSGLMLAACNPARSMWHQRQNAVPFPEPHYDHA
jgi:hypothetical protein